MKKNFIVIDIFALCVFLFSYYVKKYIGFALYNFLVLVFVIGFICNSLRLIFENKKLPVILIQSFCFVSILFMFKLDLPDRFALLIEVPKIEKRIEKVKRGKMNDESIMICTDYTIYNWEPGFLDYQWVLVYDEDDSLKDISEGEKMISEGKLYILYRAKRGFYLCILYR